MHCCPVSCLTYFGNKCILIPDSCIVCRQLSRMQHQSWSPLVVWAASMLSSSEHPSTSGQGACFRIAWEDKMANRVVKPIICLLTLKKWDPNANTTFFFHNVNDQTPRKSRPLEHSLIYDHRAVRKDGTGPASFVPPVDSEVMNLTRPSDPLRSPLRPH